MSKSNKMNVNGMCTEFSEDSCLDAFATSYEYSGISLGVNDLGEAGVTDMEYALDDNTQHYSEISNGTLGVGTSTKQWIFFNSMSTADDIVMIKFRTEGGAVNLDLLGGQIGRASCRERVRSREVGGVVKEKWNKNAG